MQQLYPDYIQIWFRQDTPDTVIQDDATWDRLMEKLGCCQYPVLLVDWTRNIFLNAHGATAESFTLFREDIMHKFVPFDTYGKYLKIQLTINSQGEKKVL